MKLPFQVVTLFAEDQRDEVQGIASLIGILPDNVGVVSFPGMLPKLAIYTRFFIEAEAELTESMSITVRHVDGTETRIAEFSPELLKETRDTALAQGNEYYGLIGQAMSSPFPVLQPGRMKVLVRLGDIEEVTGALNFTTGQ